MKRENEGRNRKNAEEQLKHAQKIFGSHDIPLLEVKQAQRAADEQERKVQESKDVHERLLARFEVEKRNYREVQRGGSFR